eukprot:7344990-Alexandrium_andersonii.AAC.1
MVYEELSVLQKEAEGGAGATTDEGKSVYTDDYAKSVVTHDYYSDPEREKTDQNMDGKNHDRQERHDHGYMGVDAEAGGGVAKERCLEVVGNVRGEADKDEHSVKPSKNAI